VASVSRIAALLTFPQPYGCCLCRDNTHAYYLRHRLTTHASCLRHDNTARLLPCHSRTTRLLHVPQQHHPTPRTFAAWPTVTHTCCLRHKTISPTLAACAAATLARFHSTRSLSTFTQLDRCLLLCHNSTARLLLRPQQQHLLFTDSGRLHVGWRRFRFVASSWPIRFLCSAQRCSTSPTNLSQLRRLPASSPSWAPACATCPLSMRTEWWRTSLRPSLWWSEALLRPPHRACHTMGPSRSVVDDEICEHLNCAQNDSGCS